MLKAIMSLGNWVQSFPGFTATSVFLSWDFGEHMDMSGECILLSSVSSQQKFEATAVRALGVS